MSRTTVTDFFNQNPIGESSFRKICLALRLNWQVVSSVDVPSKTSEDLPSTQSQLDEPQIHQIREHCRQKILEQHSRMRLLSGEEVGVDQLYVDVWLLKKPERQHINQPDSLLKYFDIENDRLALSKRIQRNPGFEIANVNSKLVILGKPGSGKTTFLKHLAVDWCNNKFQPDLISIFIELRRIQTEDWNLLAAIDKELGIENYEVYVGTQEQINGLRRKIRYLQSQVEQYNQTMQLKKESLSFSLNEQHEIESHIEDNNRQIKFSASQVQLLNQQLESLLLYRLLEDGKLLILLDGCRYSALGVDKSSSRSKVKQ
ncbi:MAG: NACHT domain-containing protein [Synechococcales bacterium]|nr:NACHT domain-containing protein [Synechococcales bacterium]